MHCRKAILFRMLNYILPDWINACLENVENQSTLFFDWFWIKHLLYTLLKNKFIFILFTSRYIFWSQFQILNYSRKHLKQNCQIRDRKILLGIHSILTYNTIYNNLNWIQKEKKNILQTIFWDLQKCIFLSEQKVQVSTIFL